MEQPRLRDAIAERETGCSERSWLMLLAETKSVMRGRLVTAGKIRLDSWFEGDIVCLRLEIGSDGYVFGNATAREIYIEGQIVGTVRGGIVHLMQGCFIEGDVLHSVLSIHPSATLIGSAIRSKAIASLPELSALEARAVADPAQLERESRVNAKIAGVDWSLYQAFARPLPGKHA
jgi:cytoskeletal protein CcmA (bactofilin family)